MLRGVPDQKLMRIPGRISKLNNKILVGEDDRAILGY